MASLAHCRTLTNVSEGRGESWAYAFVLFPV